MYQIITKSMFHDAFRKYDRTENFTSQGLSVLYDYLIEHESDETGRKLDVISLCCEYIQSTIDEALSEYDLKSIEQLMEHTIVILVDAENIIYENF
jgi:hypothetical protein